MPVRIEAYFSAWLKHGQALPDVCFSRVIMPTSDERRKEVEKLNALAIKYNLPTVDRDAPLAKLKELYRASLLVCHADEGGTDEDTQIANGVKDFFHNFQDQRKRGESDAPADQADASSELSCVQPPSPRSNRAISLANSFGCVSLAEGSAQRVH